ncbi:MAG: FtsX-like permease family protein, partial [Saprospiraceae bacterium]|nr:FtsX-like permease family protein [Saprospiraceae bacterium]
MYRSYLRSAIRNLWRYKGYTLINILGLAIGMACVMLIILYVKSELSFDRFHEHRDQLHLLNIQTTNPQTGETNKRAIGPYRLADELEVDFPDLKFVRFAPQGQERVEYQDQAYQEEDLTFVDANVFDLFSFYLEEGDPSTALPDPFSLVLTRKSAEKYFGESTALGKTLRIRDRDFNVTGILKEIPENSQFRFNMLISMNCAPQVFSKIVLENWGEGYVWTMAMLPENTQPSDFTGRMQAFTDVKLEAWKAFSPKINMHPLRDLYLSSGDFAGWQPGGDRTYVLAFSFIALFILIIACINFMNLATARAGLRAQEVGLRKVIGAERSQLITQFLSESVTLALLSFAIAMLMVKWSLPAFNQLADREITYSITANLPLFFSFLGLAVFVGLLAGSYPAFLLSGFNPIQVFSGNLSGGFKGGALRKVLVTFQFAISIFLIIVTGIVYSQIQYCRKIDLGFDKEHLVRVGTPLSLRSQYDQFRTELLTNPQVVNAGASSRVPPGSLSSSLRARPEGVPEDQQRGMQTVWTDYDFIETFGFELVSGRSFQREFTADAQTAFILNEAAVREIGWTNEEAI